MEQTGESCEKEYHCYVGPVPLLRQARIALFLDYISDQVFIFWTTVSEKQPLLINLYQICILVQAFLIKDVFSLRCIMVLFKQKNHSIFLVLSPLNITGANQNLLQLHCNMYYSNPGLFCIQYCSKVLYLGFKKQSDSAFAQVRKGHLYNQIFFSLWPKGKLNNLPQIMSYSLTSVCLQIQSRCDSPKQQLAGSPTLQKSVYRLGISLCDLLLDCSCTKLESKYNLLRDMSAEKLCLSLQSKL